MKTMMTRGGSARKRSTTKMISRFRGRMPKLRSSASVSPQGKAGAGKGGAGRGGAGERAEEIDDEDDQQVQGPDAEAAQQRERKPASDAGDDDERRELDGDERAVGDVGRVLRHDPGVEEGLDEAVPVGHRRSQWRWIWPMKARVRS